MREEDKPFVLYRKGPYNFTIVPRGVKGWAQFGVWIALLVPPSIAFAVYAEANEGRPEFWVALAVYLVATLIWSLAAISWMRARAEVVDVAVMLKLKREQERKQSRSR